VSLITEYNDLFFWWRMHFWFIIYGIKITIANTTTTTTIAD
jgi:hypothetical protein